MPEASSSPAGGGSTPPVPYLEESTQAWADQVNATFSYRAVSGAWVLEGVCPRCGHDTAQFLGEMFITKEFHVRDERPAPLTLPVLTVHCECDVAHAKDHTGCGAYGNLMNVHFE